MIDPARLPADFKDAHAFLDTLHTIYARDEVEQILRAMTEDRWLAYWINPLMQSSFVPQGELVTGVQGMWRIPVDAQFTSSAAASNGEVYIQNPSSRFAVQVLAPQADEEILDLAAAPGGKTIAIAALMNNTGRIAAVEPVKGRFHRLRANLARCGVTNVDFYQRDGRGVGRVVPERFARVLLDAPCSSEARMRWSDPVSYAHWSKRKVKETQRKQKSLLRSAYAALKPGGVLVYSTCSFSPEENEIVVAHLLSRTDAFLEDIADQPANAIAGLVAWRGRTLPEDLAKTVRIVPDGMWDGFYIARLRKPW